MASFTAGATFTDGVANDVTGSKLGLLVTSATPTSGFIQDRTSETVIATNDTLLIGDASDSNNLKRMTVANVMKAELTGTINTTAGTIATLNGTTGAITTLTTGTTTSTAEIVTSGTIATLNSTTGTIGTLVATGTITGSTNVVNIGSGQIYKDATGNVGIGTTSPIKPLDVSFASGTRRFVASYDDSLVTIKSANASNNPEVLRVIGDRIQFNIGTVGAGNEIMRLDANGNLGIGVTVGTIAGDAGPLMVSSTSSVPILAARSGDGNVMRFYRSGTQVGSINLTSGATAYVTSSDYRLKTNLEPISNGIERVKQLPVYRFNWIEDQSGNKVDGFVAHEAKAIVPECVVGEKDAVDSNGKPIHQGIDQSKIVPLLTAALKEAIAKIEVLESKVATLEAA